MTSGRASSLYLVGQRGPRGALEACREAVPLRTGERGNAPRPRAVIAPPRGGPTERDDRRHHQPGGRRITWLRGVGHTQKGVDFSRVVRSHRVSGATPPACAHSTAFGQPRPPVVTCVNSGYPLCAGILSGAGARTRIVPTRVDGTILAASPGGGARHREPSPRAERRAGVRGILGQPLRELCLWAGRRGWGRPLSASVIPPSGWVPEADPVSACALGRRDHPGSSR